MFRVSTGEDGAGKKTVSKSRTVKIGTGSRSAPANARTSSTALVSEQNANKKSKVDANNDNSLTNSTAMNLG